MVGSISFIGVESWLFVSFPPPGWRHPPPDVPLGASLGEGWFCLRFWFH